MFWDNYGAHRHGAEVSTLSSKHVLIFVSTLVMLATMLPNASHASERVSWEELERGTRLNNVRFYHKSVKVMFNGAVVQSRDRCDQCPFEITRIDDDILLNTWTIRLVNKSFHYHNAMKENELSIVFDGPDLVSQIFGGSLPEFYDMETRHTLTITSDCDRVSRIVYEELSKSFDIAEHRMARKTTNQEIDVTAMFDKLRTGTLANWLSHLPSLDEREYRSCPAYSLLSYFNQGEQSGFEFGKYTLSKQLTEHIGYIANTLNNLLSRPMQLREVTIACIGYADRIEVNSIDLTLNSFGSMEWPFYYPESCLEDRARNPAYLELAGRNSGGAIRVPNPIRDNCQLSATRAFSAIAALKVALAPSTHSKRIRYLYAAGGVAPDVDLARSRKIRLLVKLYGANH